MDSGWTVAVKWTGGGLGRGYRSRATRRRVGRISLLRARGLACQPVSWTSAADGYFSLPSPQTLLRLAFGVCIGVRRSPPTQQAPSIPFAATYGDESDPRSNRRDSRRCHRRRWAGGDPAPPPPPSRWRRRPWPCRAACALLYTLGFLRRSLGPIGRHSVQIPPLFCPRLVSPVFPPLCVEATTQLHPTRPVTPERRRRPHPQRRTRRALKPRPYIVAAAGAAPPPSTWLLLLQLRRLVLSLQPRILTFGKLRACPSPPLQHKSSRREAAAVAASLPQRHRLRRLSPPLSTSLSPLAASRRRLRRLCRLRSLSAASRRCLRRLSPPLAASRRRLCRLRRLSPPSLPSPLPPWGQTCCV